MKRLLGLPARTAPAVDIATARGASGDYIVAVVWSPVDPFTPYRSAYSPRGSSMLHTTVTAISHGCEPVVMG